MFSAADGCDFFDPTTLKVGAVLVTPIAAPVAFIAALFSKNPQTPPCT
jgi:hypothetical protein